MKTFLTTTKTKLRLRFGRKISFEGHVNAEKITWSESFVESNVNKFFIQAKRNYRTRIFLNTLQIKH